MKKKLTIGIDFGTDSVRTLLVDAENGDELASSVFEYSRWKAGMYCDASQNRFRQHPLDFIEGLEKTVKEVLAEVPGTGEQVAAISIDTTGSTPVAVDRSGTPLALTPGFEDNSDAMFVLWKDHSATDEADLINTVSRKSVTDYTKYSGGIYSSEWFWAKMIHVLQNDEQVAEAAWSWVEHCDWMPALLTGETDPLKIKRSRCAAGHKAMWNEEWGGLPPADFWNKVSPNVSRIHDHLFTETYTSDQPAGNLSRDWAERLGLHESVIVGVGALDAHIGAVGGEIIPYHMSKVIGTSTCDMLIVPEEEEGDKMIKGISGQVDGSIIPGMIGMEAGQSAFGDIYAWFRDLLLWPLEQKEDGDKKLYQKLRNSLIEDLNRQASSLKVGESGVLAVDWLNGRRTPDANPYLKGALTGLTLGSDAPRIFRALVESTAYGARMIVERFVDQGLPIQGILALGGVAKKSSFVMQVLADVLNMPIRVVRSENTCALGAAMYAAVVAGIYPDIQQAQKIMGKGFDAEYTPMTENAAQYETLYEKYKDFGKYIEKGSEK